MLNIDEMGPEVFRMAADLARSSAPNFSGRRSRQQHSKGAMRAADRGFRVFDDANRCWLDPLAKRHRARAHWFTALCDPVVDKGKRGYLVRRVRR